MAVKQHIITIVGCGPGGADYLTAIERREIERAEVLVGNTIGVSLSAPNCLVFAP